MTVRISMPFPSQFPKSHLLQQEWDSLQEYSPFILSDRFGSNPNASTPPLNRIYFADVYPLGLMMLDRMANRMQGFTGEMDIFPTAHPDVSAAFKAECDSRARYFWAFLDKWGFHSLLGSRSPWPFAAKREEASPRHRDVRVLGLHLLSSPTALQRYLLHWRDNIALRDNVDYLDELVGSRAIDLICSELIGNAFEHGWNKEKQFTQEMVTTNHTLQCTLRKRGDDLWDFLYFDLPPRLRKTLKETPLEQTLDPQTCQELADSLNENLSAKLLTEQDFFSHSFPTSANIKDEVLNSCPGESYLYQNLLLLEHVAPSVFCMPRPFIMAKLVTRDSAESALALDADQNYLQPHEKFLFSGFRSARKSEGRDYSVLQLRIPVQAGHRFRSKAATDSGGSRPPIPLQSGRRFRWEAGHFFVVHRNQWPESNGMEIKASVRS